MSYRIEKREQSWGVQFLLRMDDDWRDFATLTIANGQQVFGEPRQPDINWSAIGSVPLAQGAEFAHGLLKMIGMAQATPDGVEGLHGEGERDQAPMVGREKDG